MKLNLSSRNDIRPKGYLNIDTLPLNLPEDIYRCGPINNLDWLCADNSVDEITAINSLNRIELCGVSATLKNWHSKLILGGLLSVVVPDAKCVCHQFENDLDLTKLNAILYGDSYNEFKSLLDLPPLIKMLEDAKFHVDTVKYNGFLIYVGAVKLENS